MKNNLMGLISGIDKDGHYDKDGCRALCEAVGLLDEWNKVENKHEEDFVPIVIDAMIAAIKKIGFVYDFGITPEQLLYDEAFERSVHND